MTTIGAALHDLLVDRAVPLAVAVDRHFAPGYRQRTNGVCSNRAEFFAHIAHLREIIATTHISVVDELTDGRRYADRHIVELTKHDGIRTVVEVHVFADLDAEGRFTRVDEVTLMLESPESARDIDTAHT